MALRSNTYRYQVENLATGTSVLGTIADLTTLSDTDMTIYVDITSWASYYNNGRFITEISQFDRRIMSLTLISGVLAINDVRILKAIGGTLTGTVTFSEALVSSDTELDLSVTTTGGATNVFRRATITMIQA